MRFSVGLWDSMFGEKVTLEIPDQTGGLIKRQVTKRWLERMQQSGKIRELPTIRVHMLHPAGNRVLDWVIGEDVHQETVDKFRDSKTGDLYAMTYFEAGQPKMTVMRRSFWEKAKVVMDEAEERGAEAALERVDLRSWAADEKEKK